MVYASFRDEMNRCFLNSILQSFASLPSFGTYLNELKEEVQQLNSKLILHNNDIPSIRHLWYRGKWIVYICCNGNCNCGKGKCYGGWMGGERDTRVRRLVRKQLFDCQFLRCHVFACSYRFAVCRRLRWTDEQSG